MTSLIRSTVFRVPPLTDPTSAAINAALAMSARGGGVVLFDTVGDVTLTQPLPLVDNVTYRGAGKRATRIRNSTTDLFTSTGALHASIENLSAEVQAGGGHWLTSTGTLAGVTIRDVWAWQRNDGNHLILLANGGSMYDCLVDNTRMHHRATGTVYPINAVGTINVFSANTFSNLRLEDGPANFQFVNIECGGVSPGYGNLFSRINFERSEGGMFRLRSMRSNEISHCVQFDNASLVAHGIDADGCRDLTIRHSFRTSGTRGATARDIKLGAACESTSIEHSAPQRVNANDTAWDLGSTTGQVFGVASLNATVENPFTTQESAYPLYAITGYTATPPTNEPIIASYADKAAFDAAVAPKSSGARSQLIGWPTAASYTLLESRWTGSAFAWEVI